MKMYNEVLVGTEVQSQPIDTDSSLGIVFEVDTGRRFRVSASAPNAIRVTALDGIALVLPHAMNAIDVVTVKDIP